MKSLTQQQADHFRTEGYLCPVPILTPAEVDQALADLARYESWLGYPLPEVTDRKWKTMPFAHLPWCDKLIRDPRVLDVVEDLVGPDILVWTSTFWIKEPGSPHVAAWHQDTAYFGLEPPEQICVWLALTDATVEAGCMNVLPWRGNRPGVLRHVPGKVLISINRGTQEVVEPFDEAKAVPMPLKAGEISIHHGLMMHASAPNNAKHRRVGIGMNYIPAHVRHTAPVKMGAMLVRGEYSGDAFELMSPPTGENTPEAIAFHDDIVGRYGVNYSEQITRHERQFGKAS
ncbi:MAG: phytanoyl-CoA dioxygenase family protein [Rhodospirillaceae bacterium]